MKKKSSNSFVPVVLLFMIIALGFYTYLGSRTKNQQDVPTKTENQVLLDYDFQESYPKTVRETMKLYCRYMKSVYSGDYSDEELRKANMNMRQLYDFELLQINSEQQQLQGLKKDIEAYKEKKQKVVGYSLQEASQIQYNKEKDVEYAKTTVVINMQIGVSPASVEQEYLLRKDDQNHWKILGWQTIQPKETQNKGDSK